MDSSVIKIMISSSAFDLWRLKMSFWNQYTVSSNTVLTRRLSSVRPLRSPFQSRESEKIGVISG